MAEIIDFCGQYLNEFPESLFKTDGVEEVYLICCGINYIPDEIGNLSNLRILRLDNNKIELIPKTLFRCKKLVELSITTNRVVELPDLFHMLPELKYLYVSNNKIKQIPDSLEKCSKLTIFNAFDNRIKKLPHHISRLEMLEELELSYNKLSSLPTDFENLKKLKKLGLKNNKLELPPEVLENEYRPQELFHYYSSVHLSSEETAPLNESKLIIVGQGAVGKTSLVKRLVEGSFDQHEKITEGINICNWQLYYDNTDFRVNIWDFGGQEIMHATHQFFLTKRSVYILVLDSRLEESQNRLDYWLQLIQAYGDGSPAIVVCNKSDQRLLELDWRGLQQKYRFIIEFIKDFSCANGTGTKQLKKAIGESLSGLSHSRDPIPVSWKKIKETVETENKDYLSYTQYIALCEKENVTKEISQKTLIGFLHDLGSVLHFRDNPILKETNVLNPIWVTNGIYSLLNSNILFQNKGIIRITELSEILDLDIYPEDKWHYIFEMLLKFELVFQIPYYDRNTILIPDLLPKEEPYTGEWKDPLYFKYHYSFLSHSVISRFIVSAHTNIHKHTYWRSGCVLMLGNDNACHIKADYEDRSINIRIAGKKQNRREALSIIRNKFDAIHNSVKGLVVTEKVYLEDCRLSVSFRHLERLYEKNINEFIPEGTTKKYNVSEILGMYSPLTMFLSDSRETFNNPNDANDKEITKIPFKGWFILLLSSTAVLLLINSLKDINWQANIFIFFIALALITMLDSLLGSKSINNSIKVLKNLVNLSSNSKS